MKRIHMSEDIVVIADTQVTPTSSMAHMRALARYIWKHRPKAIVHIGDNWDFQSLSYYSSETEKEGRRLKDDLLAGANALDIITNYLRMKNAKSKKKLYKPEFHFIMGNHENRLKRFFDSHAAWNGIIDLEEMIENAGWRVHQFLDPHWIDGIAFIHYLPNSASGRPIGGSAMNKLNKFPHSFVHGHQQQYQFERRQTMDGRPHFAVCAGSFYIEDESYRGPAGNTEIRGFVHLVKFENRYGFTDFDVNFVSLERLLENY